MNPTETPSKNDLLSQLRIIDFCCALLGGVIYFLLFDFLTEILHLPSVLVRIQMAANFIYGGYGVITYFFRPAAQSYFKFLIAMNFVYAGFCVATALTLSLNSIYGGSLMLLAEGIFIALLARIERKALQK